VSETTGGGGEVTQFTATQNFTQVFSEITQAFQTGEATITGTVGRINSVLGQLGGINPEGMTRSLTAFEQGAERIQQRIQQLQVEMTRTLQAGNQPATQFGPAARQVITQATQATTRDLRGAGVEEAQIRALVASLQALGVSLARTAQTQLRTTAAENNVAGFNPGRALSFPSASRVDGELGQAISGLVAALSGRVSAANEAAAADRRAAEAANAETAARGRRSETPAAAGGAGQPPTTPPAPPAAAPPPEQPRTPTVRSGVVETNREAQLQSQRELAASLNARLVDPRALALAGQELGAGMVYRVKTGFAEVQADLSRRYFAPDSSGGVRPFNGNTTGEGANPRLFGEYEAANRQILGNARQAVVDQAARQIADLLTAASQIVGSGVQRLRSGFINTNTAQPSFYSPSGARLEPGSAQAQNIRDQYDRASRAQQNEADQARITQATRQMADTLTAASQRLGSGVERMRSGFINTNTSEPSFYNARGQRLEPDSAQALNIRDQYDRASRAQQIADEQRQLASRLQQEALTREQARSAQGALPGGQLTQVGANTFRDATGPITEFFKTFTQQGELRARRLDPANEADRGAIARIEQEYAANLRKAIAQAEGDAQREHLERERVSQATQELALANRRYVQELYEAAAETRRRIAQGQQSTNGVTQVGPSTFAIAPRATGDVGHVVEINRQGQATQLDPEVDRSRFAAAQLTAATREETAQRRLNARTEAENAAAERELTAAMKEQAKRGLLNNFLTGISNSGFGGGPAFNGQFDGLARSAGQAVKYNLLYTVMGDLQRVAGEAAKEFLDMNDSLTELEVAMGSGANITADFTDKLQNFAAIGGFNVGEAMDVAAKGIRSFRGELEAADAALAQTGDKTQSLADRQRAFGDDYAKEASRLAVLATTTLTDSAGNLAAISKGFKLPTSGAGLRQVTDAVAGAKLAGGGDETQIYQGLANSAVVFKQMGFSLREAATIISQLNSETDQSGTLLATRVSRLGQILEGSSGKQFIQAINQTRPAGTDAVDTTASARDQILALSEMFQKMNEAQRQVLTSRLGGTGQAREILVLLDKLSGAQGILAKAGDTQTFDNAGLREFEKRLENVRAQLTIIQGNLKALVTNLAASGLADPFVALVEAVKFLTGLLKGATQEIARFTGAFGPLRPIVVDLLALGLALKAVAAIRSAGSIGGALLAAEGRFAPASALARVQLAERVGTEATAGAAAAAPSVGATAAGLRAQTALRTSVDEGVVTAATRLNAAAIQLEAAEAALATAATEQQAASTAMAAAVASQDAAAISQAEGASAYAAAVATQARTSVIRARTDVGAAAGGLTAAERAARPAAEITGRTSRAIERAQADYADEVARGQRRLERIQARVDAVPAGGSTRQLERLAAQEAAVRNRLVTTEAAFQARLAAIYREREGLEIRAALAARRSGVGNFVNTATGGLLGRVGQAAQEGSRVPTFVGLGRTLSAGGSALSGLVGGPVGIGVIAALAGAAALNGLRSAFADVAAAQKTAAEELARVNGSSAEALRSAADSQEAAANALRESTGGFFGGIAAANSSDVKINPVTGEKTVDNRLNILQDVAKGLQEFTEGARATWNSITHGPASDQADQLTSLAAQNRRDAAALDRLRTQGAAAGGTEGLVKSLDFTSIDTLTASLKALVDAGYSAASVMQALTQSIKDDQKLQETHTTSDLTEARRRALTTTIAASVGSSVTNVQGLLNTFADTPTTFVGGRRPRGFVGGSDVFTLGTGGGGETITRAEVNQGRQAIDAQGGVAGLKAIVESSTQKFLTTPGLDLYSAGTADAYRQAIESTLESAKLPAPVARAIARGQAAAFAKATEALRTSLAQDDTKLLEFAKAAPANSQAVGQETTTAAKLAAAVSGNPVDLSATAGANARLNTAQSNLDLAKPLLERIKAAQPDKNKNGEIDAAIRLLEVDLDNAKLAKIEAVTADAKNLLADNERVRQTQLAHATTVAQAQSIAAGFNRTNLDVAANTGNVDVIVGAMNSSTQEQNDALKKRTDDAAAKAKLDFDAQKKVYDEAQQRKATADAAFEDLKRQAHLPGSGVTAADLDKARQEKEAADAAAGKVKAPDSTALDKANADAAAVNNALGRSNPNGGTDLQIKAALDAANATKSRDSVGQLRAARDAAQADLILQSVNKDSLAYKNALKAVFETENALADGLLDAADTARRGSIDLSNPLTVAQDALRTARDKLASDKARGASDEQIQKDTISVHEAQNTEESTRHQQRISDAQNLEQLGKISHSAYMGMLQAEHNRIQTQLNATQKGTNGYFQLTQMLIDTDLKIKQAASSLSGQFNLGDIKVPTVYEVRRSLQNSLGGQAINATTNQATTTTNNFTFQGADLSKVEAIVKQAVGAGNRVTVATRKA
jgi:hypothetical protein